MSRALVVLAVLFLGGCAKFSPPADIPCSGSSTCPTGYGCSADHVCVEGIHSVPSLTQISPTSLNAGATGVTLTATGVDFIDGSKLVLDGAELPTTRVDDTTLTAPVPDAALASGKLAPVVVRAPSPGGGDSQPATLTITNPAVTLASVSPTSAVSGAASTTLTVTGSGFVPASQVLFDGTPVTATRDSPTQLTAIVPSSLLARSRAVQVVVSNSAPGGGTSAPQPFRIDPAIHTFRGGYTGDGGPATGAVLPYLRHFAFSPSGELYFSEPDYHRIMKVDANGKVVQVAGITGVCGFSGDGGPALAARLCYPDALTFNPAGDLYVFDSSNGRLRKISGGVITTVAGDGSCANDLDTNGSAVWVNQDEVTIGGVEAMASDSQGNIYLATDGCAGHKIRKFIPDTGAGAALTTIVGTGDNNGNDADGYPGYTVSIDTPVALTVHTHQTAQSSDVDVIYIAEEFNDVVRKAVNDGAGKYTVTTVAGMIDDGDTSGDTGPATAAGVPVPHGVAFDDADNLYIAEAYGQIRKVNATDGIINRVAGTDDGQPSVNETPALTGVIGHPMDLQFHAGQLYWSTPSEQNTDINAVMTIDGSGKLQTVLGMRPRIGDASNTSLASPHGVAVDSKGNVFISDTENARVLRVDVLGNTTVYAGSGIIGEGGDGGPAASARLNNPAGLAVAKNGDLYIADEYNWQVRKVSAATGLITTVAGSRDWPDGCPGGSPTSSPNGDPGYNCIGDTYAATQATVVNPRAVLYDDATQSLYISEGDAGWSGGDRVRRVDANGIITTVAGSTATSGGGTCDFGGDNGPASNALLCQPEGLALDPNGDLLVADRYNHRIRKINLTSTPALQISTWSGSNFIGMSGDGGPVGAATWTEPVGLAFDSAGTLYVSDAQDNVVRKVSGGIITRLAGTGAPVPFDHIVEGGAALTAPLHYPHQVAVSPDASLVYIADTYDERIRVVGP